MTENQRWCSGGVSVGIWWCFGGFLVVLLDEIVSRQMHTTHHPASPDVPALSRDLESLCIPVVMKIRGPGSRPGRRVVWRVVMRIFRKVL